MLFFLLSPAPTPLHSPDRLIPFSRLNHVPPHVQELLAAVARELCLPPDDGLLAPLAALEAPSFAAAPAFRGPLPEGAGARQLRRMSFNHPRSGLLRECGPLERISVRVIKCTRVKVCLRLVPMTRFCTVTHEQQARPGACAILALNPSA